MLWEQLKGGGTYGRLNRVISIVICDHIAVDALKEISMSDHARAPADARQKVEWAL
ncbi:hypothetical protein FACS189444_3910 [Spirochaetia bacterium]|nr:hypothetical protein FACS189444_3910 [Spirochaetia bacterium]